MSLGLFYILQSSNRQATARLGSQSMSLGTMASSLSKGWVSGISAVGKVSMWTVADNLAAQPQPSEPLGSQERNSRVKGTSLLLLDQVGSLVPETNHSAIQADCRLRRVCSKLRPGVYQLVPGRRRHQAMGRRRLRCSTHTARLIGSTQLPWSRWQLEQCRCHEECSSRRRYGHGDRQTSPTRIGDTSRGQPFDK